ncbi:MAG: hypothetical protein IKM39_03415 [Clostridia bacterium]|nr:hypothetical protein [Clostridia bacterium]
MDIFCEQIVKKKKTTFEKLTVALIWVVGWLLCMGLVLLGLNFYSYFMLALLAAGIVVYFSIKFASRLNLEYEYSVTNGLLDIDKIINRSDRKRMISVEINTFDRFEEFDAQNREFDPKRYDSVVVAVADPMGEDAVYAAVVRHPVKGRILIVFQPNEKVLSVVKQALPRTLQTRRFG